MSNAAKNFDVLATSLSVLIILTVQQNYFSDLYSAKILDLSDQRNHFFHVERYLMRESKNPDHRQQSNYYILY